MAMTLALRLGIGCFLITSLALGSAAQDESLTDERFRELHEQLQPSESERWRTIPWMTSVIDAQQAAAEGKKPIFIWAMDGHPLGCT